MVAGGYRAIERSGSRRGTAPGPADITPEETPFEAGLGFAVRMGKGDFLGRDALVAAEAAGPAKRLRCLVLDDPALGLPGNEPVSLGGEVVGRVTSGGYGFSVGRSIAYAYLPPDAAIGGAARWSCSARGWASRWCGRRFSTRPARDPVLGAA